jgi:hypothetical protein
MIASNRCSSRPVWWLLINPIIPVRKGTCLLVPDRESGQGIGGSGVSGTFSQALPVTSRGQIPRA